MGDSLFAARKEWMRLTGAPAVFNRLAKRLALNQSAFSQCAGGSKARERIRLQSEVARRLNIRGTPTFFINGERVEGAIPLPLFRQVLDQIRR
jgi:protein-disulfide isomerase